MNNWQIDSNNLDLIYLPDSPELSLYRAPIVHQGLTTGKGHDESAVELTSVWHPLLHTHTDDTSTAIAKRYFPWSNVIPKELIIWPAAVFQSQDNYLAEAYNLINFTTLDMLVAARGKGRLVIKIGNAAKRASLRRPDMQHPIWRTWLDFNGDNNENMLV